MLNSLITTLKYFWAKIFLTIPITFLVITQEHYTIIWGLVFVIVIDTILGIWVAIRHKVFASYKLQRITDKVIKYAFFLYIFFILSCVAPLAFGWTFQSAGVFLILTEVFSNLEKLSILGVEIPTKVLAKLNEDFREYYFGDTNQSKEALKRILNKEQASCRKDRIPITILNSKVKEV